MGRRKTHERKYDWKNYLIQLSVVIIGVMVTFTGSNLIGRWTRARQVRAVMALVSTELENNRAALVHVCEKLRSDREGMRMLGRYGYDADSVPLDSLQHYPLLAGSLRGLTVRSDALEVLKTAGVIASVGDKQVLLEVLGCYKRLETFRGNVEVYNERKLSAMNHFFAGLSAADVRRFTAGDDVKLSWKLLLGDPMCLSFFTTGMYFFGEEDRFDELVDNVDATLATLDQIYGFK